MIHSFLLIGQSNAAGRGLLNEAPPLNNLDGRIKVQRNGRWQDMFRPLNPDRYFSGYCFAESFAIKYAEANPYVEVGIIPCADGGTGLGQWQQGEALFDNAVNCAKLAMRTSHLVGILWHQGEGDCAPEACITYAERFGVMLNALRKELNLPGIPVVLGGLGDFLGDFTTSVNISNNYKIVNEQLKKIANDHLNCEFVSAQGLGGNTDNLHFSASSLEEFGRRYYDAFTKLDISETLNAQSVTDTDTVRTALEKL